MSYYGNSKISKNIAYNDALMNCWLDNYNNKSFNNEDCLLYSEQSQSIIQKLTGKKSEEVFWEVKKAAYETKLKNAKKRKEKDPFAIKKYKDDKEYIGLIIKAEKKFRSQCEKSEGFERGSTEYLVCLEDKEYAEKLSKKLLAKMDAEEKSIYKCEKTFGYRKGSKKHQDCVFEMYKTEIEFEKLELQKANEKQRLELEREKVKAANAQAEAAREQAEAAKRNAEANESSAYTADRVRRQKQMQRGIRSLSDNCILKGTC